ncbi:hypothetical protein [Bartonella schoenbuchensis]|uniref:hypothetical protein n=1 Tax=Bartonella schoenbuchensis TaxID=165694 RepID=UPI0031451823
MGEAGQGREWMDVGWLLRGRLVSVEGRLSLKRYEGAEREARASEGEVRGLGNRVFEGESGGGLSVGGCMSWGEGSEGF